MAEEKKIITAGDIDDKGGVLQSDVTEFDATQCLTKKNIIDSYKNVQVINDSFTNNQLVTDEAIAVLKMGTFDVMISCPEFTSDSLIERLEAFHIVVPTYFVTASNGQTTSSYEFFSITTDYDTDTCGIKINDVNIIGNIYNRYVYNPALRQTKKFNVNLTSSFIPSYETENIIHGGGGATLYFPSIYHDNDGTYSGNYGVVTARKILNSTTTYYKMKLDTDASTLTVSNNRNTFYMVFKKTGETLTEI